jgi:hypothetical protein
MMGTVREMKRRVDRIREPKFTSVRREATT